MSGARRLRDLHLALTIIWALLVIPTIVWWKTSVLWVGLCSCYANSIGHAAAYAGARVGGASGFGRFLCAHDSSADQGYRKLSAGEVFRLHDERRKAEEAAAPPPKPVVARLFIASPDGEETCYSAFDAADRLEEVTARLREHLGDRVRVQHSDGPEFEETNGLLGPSNASKLARNDGPEEAT